MIDHLLTDKELELVLELLEAESRSLAVEVRRTDTTSVREQLRHRHESVNRLIQRFQEVKSGTYSA